MGAVLYLRPSHTASDVLSLSRFARERAAEHAHVLHRITRSRKAQASEAECRDVLYDLFGHAAQGGREGHRRETLIFASNVRNCTRLVILAAKALQLTSLWHLRKLVQVTTVDSPVLSARLPFLIHLLRCRKLKFQAPQQNLHRGASWQGFGPDPEGKSG